MSAQQSTPPPSGAIFDTAFASAHPSTPHDQGEPRSAHPSFENAFSTPQSFGGVPTVPHPNTSFAVAFVWRHPDTQLQLSHPGRLSDPIAHSPHPGPLCRVTKKAGGPGAAPSHPVIESCATSASLSQTCHPNAHRSHAEHPSPFGLPPSSPPF